MRANHSLVVTRAERGPGALPETPNELGAARCCYETLEGVKNYFRLLFREQSTESFRVGHWRFAGEVLANVSGRFAVDHRHRANRFVFFAEIFLAFAAVGEQQNLVG